MIVDEFITFIGFKTDLKPGEAAKNVMSQLSKGAVALAAGMTGAAAAIGFFANSTARSIAIEKDLADSIGVSFKSLQTLQYAIEATGGSAEEADGAIQGLHQQALMMGKDKAIEDVLISYARRLKGMSKIGQKQMLEATGMTPTLIKLVQSGEKNIIKTYDEIEKKGSFVTDKAAKNAQEYVKQMNVLKRTISRTFQGAITAALPEITKLIQSIRDWIAVNKEVIKIKIIQFVKGFSKGFGEAISVIKNVIAVIKNVIAAFIPFGEGMDSMAIISGTVKYAVLGLAAIIASKFVVALYSAGKGIMFFTKNLYTSIGGIYKFIVASKDLSPGLLKFRQGLGKAIKAVSKFALTMVKTAVKGVIKFVGYILTTAIPALISFAATFFTTVIPAVAAFSLALLTNPLTWIILGVVAAIAAVTTAVVLLVKWFNTIMGATGNLGDTFIVIGQTMLKAMMMPINTIISGIVKLLNFMSKIPLVGDKFKKASKAIKEWQDTKNKQLTGSANIYDLTGPTRAAITRSRTAEVAPARPVYGGATNNAKMEQTININGAANPNEIGRQVAGRTANTIQSLYPGTSVAAGSY